MFGYSNSGPDKGKLMQSAGNPFNYTYLADLINAFNCPDISFIGTDDENQYAFYLYPHNQPSGSGSGIKGGGMDEINASFINLTEKIKGIPETSQVFDGFLIGMIVDAGVHNPGGSGTNPGDTPGGPGGPGGEDPGETQYTITYTPGAPEEEVTGMPEPRTYTVNAGGSHEVSPVEPVREGYDFDGWSDGTVTYTGGQIISNITASITLEAQWSIEILPTLTFVAEDATINYAPGFTIGQSFQKGTDINEIVTNTTATKEGEEFLGWSVGDTIYTSDHTESILITEDLTLTVVWKTKHTLTFNANGGTGGPANITFYAGDTIDIPETVPTKEGAVFAGWKYDGSILDAGGNLINAPDHDITLVAQWTQTWTVSFEIGEAQGTAPASITVENNGNVTLPQPTGFSRTGYTFDGWTLGSQTYSAGYNYGPVTSDLTFTADWSIMLVHVYYHANHELAQGTTPKIDGPMNYGDIAHVLPYHADHFLVPGFNLVSWNTAANGSGTTYYAGDPITLNGDVNLYAQWQADVQQVVFSAGTITDATEIPEPIAIEGSTITIPNVIPKYIPAGATISNTLAASFNHWVRSDNSQICYPGQTISVSGSLTLTANWTKGCHTIRTQADLATIASNLSANYVLANNITMSGNWAPIGSPSNMFTGKLNGNGYSCRI